MTTISLFSFSQLIWNFNNFLTDSNSPTEFDMFNELKTSNYSPNYSNTGENMALVLHQSYLNNSFNTILNTSDPNNNEFTVPSPEDSTFNSSYTYFKVEDIVAQNKTIEIETGTARAQDIITDWSFSFEIPQSSILKNFSIALSDNTGLAGGSDIALRLFNATHNGGLSRIEPDVNTLLVSESQNMPMDSGPIWYDFIVNVDLDYSQTYGGTFFIRVWRISGGSTVPQFNYQRNTDGTDVNNSLTYREPSSFVKREWEASLKVGLGLYDNTPNPTAINLEINNTIVSDDVGNSGYWIKQNQNYTDNDGNLDFNITADWWDVQCNISQVQINYTKTDLKASSEFNIAGSGEAVEWDVTRNGGLNFFDPRLSNYRINFTIPSTWNNINVLNGPVDKTGDVSINPNKNSHKTIQVVNAGNGTYWHLTATTENLLWSIDTHVNFVATVIVKYSEIVEFSATFKEIIAQNDGVINLSVYNPSAIDNKLNFTSLNSTFASNIEFYLGSWDISDTITQYGEFRVQVSWSNNTAAGFSEKILTILGETDMSLIRPSQDATFYTNQSFDIIVYYEDFNLVTSIDEATIEYNIEGQGLQSTTANNGTIGYYVIPVDCSVFTSDGPKIVDISVNKQYYDSQSIIYYFNIIVVEEPSELSQPTIPGYEIIALVGVCFVITILFIRYKNKK